MREVFRLKAGLRTGTRCAIFAEETGDGRPEPNAEKASSPTGCATFATGDCRFTGVRDSETGSESRPTLSAHRMCNFCNGILPPTGVRGSGIERLGGFIS